MKMLKITSNGQLQKKLDDLDHNVKSLSGQQVPIPELLTPQFLGQCSRFQSAEEMFTASGFKIDSAEDFAAIPDAEWDEFICTNTTFDSWGAMLGQAGGEWARRQLGF
jgi:hypothetical protein